jgi:hypothetical protein
MPSCAAVGGMCVAKANASISCSTSTARGIKTVRCTHSPGSPRRLRHLTEIFPACNQKVSPLPSCVPRVIDAKASSLSAVGNDCTFVSGLLPLGLAHLEELFSDSVLWHVAEPIEDCQNGRPADVTFLKSCKCSRKQRCRASGEIM